MLTSALAYAGGVDFCVANRSIANLAKDLYLTFAFLAEDQLLAFVNLAVEHLAGHFLNVILPNLTQKKDPVK